MNKKMKKIIIIAVAVIAVVILIPGFVAKAIINEDELVHIKDSQVEAATLIIGTHLIHISAMTDEIYEIAQKSQSESNQTEIYYKSELADGSWYAITNAAGIKDIMQEGTPVKTSEIEQLGVRYYTKSDKLTYDLKTGEAVCIFNINDPYSISDNSDLESVATQKQQLEEKNDKNKSDKYYLDILNEFSNQRIDGLDNYDSVINNLWDYYRDTVQGDSDAAEAITGIMKKVDASRREEIYGKLSDELLQQLLEKASLTNVSDTDINTNSEVISAIGESIQQVEKSRAEYNAQKLESGDSVLSQTENEMIEKVASVLAQGAKQTAGEYLKQYVALKNIEEEVSKDSEYEKKVLEQTLIPKTKERIESLLKQGESDEYKEAKKEGKSQTVLQQLKSKQLSEISQAFAELEYNTSALSSRLETAEATQNFEAVLDYMDGLDKIIQGEDLKSDIEKIIYQYEDNIKDNLMDYESGGTNELDSLLEQKKELQLEKQQALDKNDLTLAKEADKKLEEINQKIDAQEQYLNSIINSDTASDVNKAKARQQLSGKTASGNIEEYKNNALSAIDEKDFDSVGQNVSAIEAAVSLSPETAKNALKEIYQKLTSVLYLSDTLTQSEKDAVSGQISNIEQITADNSDLFSGNDLNADKIAEIIKAHYGKVFGRLNEKEQAAVTIAVSQYADYINSAQIEQAAASYAGYMYNYNNGYVYETIKDGAVKYVALENLAFVKGYRYVYIDSLKEATLQNGYNFYKFHLFHSTVQRQDGTEVEMNSVSKLKNTLQIPEDYAYSEFGCYCEYIKGSSYAVIYNAEILDEVDILFDKFLYR